MCVCVGFFGVRPGFFWFFVCFLCVVFWCFCFLFGLVLGLFFCFFFCFGFVLGLFLFGLE